jgi:predicted DCC family thiol-disulfide oxidoreductase YuxK
MNTSVEQLLSDEHPVLLFDGVCNLCNGAVTFVLQRDSHRHFRYASLQSASGQALLDHFGLPKDAFDSFVLIEKGRFFTKSTAALHVARNMNALWPMLSVFLIVPAFLRNAVYDLIAKNRYRWFGKRDACMMPSPELKALFLP